MELEVPEGRVLPEDSGSDIEGGQSTWGYGERTSFKIRLQSNLTIVLRI